MRRSSITTKCCCKILATTLKYSSSGASLRTFTKLLRPRQQQQRPYLHLHLDLTSNIRARAFTRAMAATMAASTSSSAETKVDTEVGMDASKASRGRNLKLLKNCKAALDEFLVSGERFRVVHTVPSSASIASPSSASTTTATTSSVTELEPKLPPRQKSKLPQTIFILDSSYNPPQRLHHTLARSALLHFHGQPQQPQQQQHRYPRPWRLLLLFSVHNADKQPAPAAFEARIGCMVRFAEHLSQSLASSSSSSSSLSSSSAEGEERNHTTEHVDIDIGLTLEPFYTDKSTAIEASGAYCTSSSSNGGDPAVTAAAAQPKHIHLVGYDTYIRILTPKYYIEKWGKERPLQALQTFFSERNHGLRVTIRPDEKTSAAEQRHEIERLGNGELDEQGAQTAWMDNVQIVEATSAEDGQVSSTRVRNAVQDGDWAAVKRLCCDGVVCCIRDWELYI